MYIKDMEPRKRANVLVFDGQWKVVVENNHTSKTSKCARFRGVGRWWWWRTTTAPKNEQTCSLPRAWKVVVVENNHRP